MNSTQTTAAVCEIQLNNGYNCGVQAIGRCAPCGRAFCLTHQAQDLSKVYTSVPGMCASCWEAVQASIRKEQEEWRAAVEYFESGAARTALLASGVQSVEIFRREHKFQKGFLGLGGRYMNEVNSFGRGWLVGESPWHHDLVAIQDNPAGLLMVVGSYSEGYIFHNYIELVWSPTPHKWTREAAQAVKRLVGASN